MTSENLSEQKTLLRNKILARRDGQDESLRIEHSLAAADHGAALNVFSGDNLVPGTIVSGFFPIRSEIDPHLHVAACETWCTTLFCPSSSTKPRLNFGNSFVVAELVESGYGTVGPGDDGTVLDPEILVMPLSVFDGDGGRIGYGAGYYDRAVARLIEKGIEPRLIGMAYSLQQVERVPMEAHDRALEGVITEAGYVAAQ